ncbi:right-handed parallel beta-helix repeat-containing protein [Micromonospora sp. WMMD967]|uniref:right-handed parallel beta-helix repeat-containing protein n=1 Tax=Micromonospora sp. WMMD967 TaxID=3016101 RepID=UPI002415AA96|nr:right-handed parallel beta-helix repeat-containing protein [Micromonospora sp. WMMD967]MDG4835639.1 right-handed parallel beta-helix repeat-containing protein [Micromonospora sp. WMMD967]
MDRRIVTGLAVVPLLAGVGLVGPAAPAVAAAPEPVARAAANSANELYVSGKDCTSGADGTEAAPYCTISAAAAVAQPGQTVLVQPGDYPETVTFTRSGTETAPITFRAVATWSGRITVGNIGDTVVGTVFRFTGVHDVVVEGFIVEDTDTVVPVVVDASTRVTINDIAARAYRAPATVHVTGNSSDVTISRAFLTQSTAPAIRIDPGVRGTMVVNNQLHFGGLLATDAPGTIVTNNTVLTNCVRGIDVVGNSTGLSVQNNIVRTSLFHVACKTPQDAIAIAVAAPATGTVSDYNLIDPISGGPVYQWAGTAYSDLASFRAATGQGGHDITADPLVAGSTSGGPKTFFPADPTSPAVDSANALAPGVTRTDTLGNPHSDNPAVANTGTGNGFHDRGAVEAQGSPGKGQYDLRQKPGDDSFAVTATVAPQFAWPVDGEGGTISYRFDGKRYPIVTSARSVDSSFREAGKGCAYVSISYTGFRWAETTDGTVCTRVGTRYTPTAPTRLLDTRSRIGTATTAPVPANGEVTVPIPAVSGVSAADITAVVLNLTVTAPTMPGFISIRGWSGELGSSSVNFVANETVPNLVMTRVNGGVVRLVNRSGGTVHLLADLQGVYSRQGSGFKTLDPTRVLDTRTGTGGPLAANGERRLDLSGKLPVDATAAILNVTVTAPTTAGVLSVYPEGSPAPLASNLNFVARQTIPNLVVVPVVAGKVMFRNVSSGTTHVVADLAGYFGSAASGADQTYVPSEGRVADSRDDSGWIRTSHSGPFPAFAVGGAPISIDWCGTGCPRVTAGVLNLTVTAPAAAGVLTAYPSGATRPTASNVNFVAGETASNLVVSKSDGYVDVFNNSSGTAHLIADQSGYFIASAY